MFFVLLFTAELISLFFLSRVLTKSISRVLLVLTNNKTATIHLLSFLFLPGVIVHELSHLLTASVLFVPVGEVEFVPKITDNGIKLGSVAIAKTDPIRHLIIGLAPALAGVSAILGFLFYINPLASFPAMPIWKIAAVLYVVFEIGNTMFSSKKDLEGALAFLVLLAILFLAVYLIGFRVELSIFNFLFSDKNIGVIKMGNVFLLFPIIADLLIYIFIAAVMGWSRRSW